MKSALLTIVLFACGEPAAVDASVRALPAGALPPPQAMSLRLAPSWALSGSTVLVDVWDAPLGRAVGLGASRATSGTHPCPPALAGACVDLFGPVVVVGSALPDASGHAQFSVTVPANLPPGGVRFQAVSFWPQGQGSVSNVAGLSVLSTGGDQDLDGLTNGAEAGLGTDPTSPDTDRGGRPDGQDALPLDPHDDEGAPPATVLPGDLAPALPAGEQSAGAAASGAGVTLVVWQDSRAGASTAPQYGSAPVDLFAARFDGAGEPLDATPIVLAQGVMAQEDPDVAWNGSEFLVVWSSAVFVGDFGQTVDIHGARVTASGDVLDAVPLVIDGNPAADAALPVVASDGVDWLVVWRGGIGAEEGILAAKVTAGGQLRSPKALWATSNGVGFSTPFRTDVAWATDRYLVVGSHLAPGGSDAIFGIALNGAGTVLGPEVQIVAGTEAALASNGVQFGLAWYEPVGWGEVSVSPLSLTGSLLVPGGTLLDDQLYGTLPTTALSWDGSGWVVAWDPGGPLRMAEVASNGAVAPGSPFEASSSPNAREPFLAPLASGRTLVGWTDHRLANPSGLGSSDLWGTVLDGVPLAERPLTTSPSAQSQADLAGPVDGAWLVVFVSESSDARQVLAQRVDASGVAIDAEPFVITTSSTWLRQPRVAHNGASWLVVWEDAGTHAQLVDDTGALVGGAQRVLSADQPDVAASGDDFLVVGSQMPAGQWQTRLIVSQRVLADGSLAPQGTVLSVGFNQHPSVTGDAQGWVVAWQSHFAALSGPITVAACAVAPDGTPSASSIVGQSAVYNEHAALASSGTGLLLTWSDGAGVRGRRFDAALSPLDGLGGFLISDAPGDQLLAASAWNGASWRVAWLDERAEGSSQPVAGLGDVYAAKVSAVGTVTYAGGAAVAADPARLEVLPSVSGDAGSSLTAWTFMDPSTSTLRTGLRPSP